MSYADCAGRSETAGVGVEVLDVAGVDFAGAGLEVFTTCHTSLLPLFTHLKDAVFVLATAPSLVHAAPAFAAELDAENAIGAERIPMATAELIRTSENFFEELVMERRYILLSAGTSHIRYLYCYRNR